MINPNEISKTIQSQKKPLMAIRSKAVNAIFDMLRKNDLYQEYTTMELIEFSEDILIDLSKTY
jgi:hypothetical protein